jgi:hypothetical protein
MTCWVCENARSGGLEVHRTMSYRPLIWRLFFYGGLGLLFFITTQMRFVSYLTHVFAGSPASAKEVFRDLLHQDLQSIIGAVACAILGVAVGGIFGEFAISNKTRRLKCGNDNLWEMNENRTLQ